MTAWVTAAGLPVGAQDTVPVRTANTEAPLRVRVGEQLVLRAPVGVIHAEAADPSIAAVSMPSPDTIVVRGIRPDVTALLCVTATTVVSEAVQVAPPLTLAGTLIGSPAPVGFVDLTYLPWTQAFWMDIHRPGLDATIGSGAFQVHLLSGTVTIVAASALQTPLQNFGLGGGSGASVRTADGWEFVASSSQTLVGYHWRLGGRDEVALAETVVGPLATLHLQRSPIGLDVAALYQGGAAETAGAVTTQIGSVPIQYWFSPLGNGVSTQLAYRSWTLGLGAGPLGLQVSLAGPVGSDHLSLWWTAQGGYGFGATLPIGPGGALTASGSSGAVFVATTAPTGPESTTGTTSFGAGYLTVTSPSTGFPTGVTVPTALRLSPPVQPLTPWAPYPVTPEYVRARLEISAAPVVGPVASPPASDLMKPVSVPSGSVALIVHVCLHSGNPKTTCDPTDPLIAVRLYVDDQPMEYGGVALPVPPGPHLVSIRPQDVPPFLVALGALTCPINPTPGGVVVCDFAFRRAGTP